MGSELGTRIRSSGGPAYGALERILPRAASSAVSLVVAAVAGPTAFGYYALATLVLTGLQALTDTTLRQAGLSLFGAESTRRLVEKSGWTAAIASTVALVGLLMGFWASAVDPRIVLALGPLVLVPSMWMISLPRTLDYQRRDSWRYLANVQLAASALSIGAAGGALLLSEGVLAASLQTLCSEAFLGAILLARPIDRVRSGRPEVRPFVRVILPLGSMNLLGWCQGQAERLVLGLLGPVSVLGLYSLVVAVARALPDAAATGLVNVLRARLSLSSDEEKPLRLKHLLQFVCAFSLLAHVSLAALSSLVLPRFFGSSWALSLICVPILSLGILPATLSWCFSAYVVDSGRGSALLPTQLSIIAMSLGSGAVLAYSLILGCCSVAAREYVGAALRLRVLGVRLVRGVRTLFAATVLMCLVVSVAALVASR